MTYERSFGLTPVFGLRREIDRLFDDVFTGRGGSGGGSWRPAVDVHESANELRFDVEIPGIRLEDIELNVENGVLSIRGEKSEERKEDDKEGRYHILERSYGSFFRSFQLPQGVDESQINADIDQGVLHIRIPKTALPQPRRIEIGQSGSGRTPVGTGGRGERSTGRATEPGRAEAGRDRMVAGSKNEGRSERGRGRQDDTTAR
jgi:HSP20 family protein